MTKHRQASESLFFHFWIPCCWEGIFFFFLCFTLIPHVFLWYFLPLPEAWNVLRLTCADLSWLTGLTHTCTDAHEQMAVPDCTQPVRCLPWLFRLHLNCIYNRRAASCMCSGICTVLPVLRASNPTTIMGRSNKALLRFFTCCTLTQLGWRLAFVLTRWDCLGVCGLDDAFVCKNKPISDTADLGCICEVFEWGGQALPV